MIFMPKHTYTKKELKQEDEATSFACSLLMPFDMFDKEFKSRLNLSEEDRIKELAKIFDAPQWAVVIRMKHYHKLINN